MQSSDTNALRRRPTRSNIFQYLYYQKDFCSKQSIATDLGLSLPTIYQNLTELMEEGLICYTAEHRYTGGRRSVGLQVVSGARLAVGISISNDRVRFLLADLHLNVIAQRKISRKLDGNMEALAGFLSEELESFLDEHLCDRSKLLGVGIAFPGIISEDGGSMVMAPTMQLQDPPLKVLREAISYPICIRNDANCGGHAEWFICRQKSEIEDLNLAYLSLENGVGGAILLRGKPFNGDHGRSGEFGHMTVEKDGRKCACGKRGCLEAYCSAHRISRDLGITPDEFFTEKDNGNSKYAAIWDDMLRHLAVAINNINVSLDCDVILGGFLSEYLEKDLETLRSYVRECNPFTSNGNFVRLSELKSYSVPLGAALYFIQNFVESV